MNEHSNSLVSSDEPFWVHRLRDAVQRVLETEIDQDAASLYLVAVTEIVVNAEEVHELAGVAVPVLAEVDVQRRQVTVTDHGGGFDPDDQREPAPSDQERGRGLRLAQAFCPGLSATKTPEGMRFSLPFPPTTDPVSRRGS